MPYAGQAAALSTAILWAFTSLSFSEAAHRVGGFHVNKLRLFFATCIYALILLITTGVPLPLSLSQEAVFWLCLSSLIGIVIGDTFIFIAFTTIGPRLTTLIYASSPIMATFVAWIFMGEKLSALDMLGIGLTLGGICWVVAERRPEGVVRDEREHHHGPVFRRGVLAAFGGAFGQAAGLVTSKQALVGTGQAMSPLEGAYVRILFGFACMFVIGLVRGQIPATLRAARNREAMLFTLGGTIVGPFLGIWMSLVAVSLIEAGVAATLNSMVPVFVIPLVILFKKEHVSARAIFGSILAVGGVALLFLN